MTQDEIEFWEWIGIKPPEEEKKYPERNEDKAVDWEMTQLFYERSLHLK